jgi:hypothetical protein
MDFSERLLRRFLLLCENPRTQRRALALVRGSVSNARAGRAFYALVNRVVVNPVARAMGVQSSAVRMELVGSQLIGLAMIRYVLKVEPIASGRRGAGAADGTAVARGADRQDRADSGSASRARHGALVGQRTRMVALESRNPWPPLVWQRSPCLVLVHTIPR